MSLNDAGKMANSVDPDQTAPGGAFSSGYTLFAQTRMSEYLGSLVYVLELSQLTEKRTLASHNL